MKTAPAFICVASVRRYHLEIVGRQRLRIEEAGQAYQVGRKEKPPPFHPAQAVHLGTVGRRRFRIEEAWELGRHIKAMAVPVQAYHLEIVGRQRFRIEEAWELDGYRMARPAPVADARPAPGSAEAAELAALAAQVTQLVAQWIERVRRAPALRGVARRYSVPELVPLNHVTLNPRTPRGGQTARQR